MKIFIIVYLMMLIVVDIYINRVLKKKIMEDSKSKKLLILITLCVFIVPMISYRLMFLIFKLYMR